MVGGGEGWSLIYGEPTYLANRKSIATFCRYLRRDLEHIFGRSTWKGVFLLDCVFGYEECNFLLKTNFLANSCSVETLTLDTTSQMKMD